METPPNNKQGGKKTMRISPVLICSAAFFIGQPTLVQPNPETLQNLPHTYSRLLLVYFHLYFCVVQMNSGLLHYR